MRAFTQLQFLLTEDLAQHQVLTDLLLSLDNTTFTLAETGTHVLAPAAANVAISFGGVTRAGMVLVVAWSDITVKLEGTGSPAIPVRTLPADDTGSPASVFQKEDQPGFFFWYGKVTSLHLGNPSATESATVFVALLGDAAA